MQYNFSKLWASQFLGFYKFKSFYEYASDKNAQTNYYKKLGVLAVDENGELRKQEITQYALNEIITENESVLDMIKNQMLVFLFTRYEFIIQDTVKCLICDNSERILTFIKVYPSYEADIRFSLKEFIECESKEEYIKKISERLSSRILSGKPSKVINRIKCLLPFENVDTDLLDDLMLKRNNIVHEGQIYEIELNKLESYYDAIENLLKILATALKNIQISIIDDGGLLDK